MTKKVLIIAYYWPPAGGPGVQRWLKFVKYLRDFNIAPIVYVPENPNYPITDTSFTSEIPTDIVIIKRPIFEPYRFAKLFSKNKTSTISKGMIPKGKQSFAEKILLYIRGNFFIPDARKFWIRPSTKFLTNYLHENPVDTIITTGPPHSMHLIGMALQKSTNTPWIADFRDPWTRIGYHTALKLSKRSQATHKQLEKSVLQNADHIITTSFTTKQEFSKLTQQPIEVITNGFDVENSDHIELDTKFTLSHIGSLLSDRNPTILWEVLAELIEENTDFASDVQLQFAGMVSDVIKKSIDSCGLDAYTNYLGYVSHQEAVALQRASQVVVLIEIDTEKTRGIIAGKLFEYMAANRPILGIGPSEADIEKIIKETHTGTYFLYTEKEALKKQIQAYYTAYKKGELHVSALGLQRYSRKALTEKLSKLIHNIP